MLCMRVMRVVLTISVCEGCWGGGVLCWVTPFLWGGVVSFERGMWMVCR